MNSGNFDLFGVSISFGEKSISVNYSYLITKYIFENFIEL